MAIQPIDLQGMYNQMRNMAQSVTHQQQGIKLAESLQQQNMIQQNMEASERVHQTSNDNSKSSLVKDNGGGSGAAMRQGKKHEHESEDSEENQAQQNNIKDPLIGRIIDITR